MQSKTVQLRTSPPNKPLPAKQPTIFRLFHQPHLFVERASTKTYHLFRFAAECPPDSSLQRGDELLAPFSDDQLVGGRCVFSIS